MSEVSAIAQFDFHVHTSLSHDGKGTVDDYCQLAVKKGMKAIGFCEHVDLDPKDVYYGRHDYESYREQIEEARAKHGNRLMIRMGAEIGYVPRIREQIGEYLCEHPYDYVIGSVHEIFDGAAGISEEYNALETFARYEFMEAYDEYFQTVCEMVACGLFDVVGHLDLIQRFGASKLKGELEWGRFYGVIRKILEGAMKREMAVEINTSGLRQLAKSTFPDRYVLCLYRELTGSKVIIGSDAHEPDALGAGVPVAISLAKEYDLDPMVSFKDRMSETICR